MPIYRYKGFNKDGGKAVSGSIEAEGMKDAALKIKALGLYPKSIEPESSKKHRSLFSKKDSASLAAITRQLAVLVGSGVPLSEALRALSDERKGPWKFVLVGIKESVMGGASLSRAMEAQEEGLFPDFYISMVAAGEESGNLDTVLSNLSDYMERQEEIKDKVRTATVYPMFMIGIGMLVMTFLFTFVVPKIVRIFEDTEAALPLVTVILIGISNFFVNYWWLLPGLAVGGLLAARTLKKRKLTRIHQYQFKVFQSLYLSRLSRNLGFLLSGGLPMLRALELAGRATGNRYLEVMVKQAALKVSEGASLSGSLEGLPPIMLQLISTGERSGKLPKVLSESADAYESEFNRVIQKGLALLEPVIILLMAVVVGFIVFAVLLPMFQLNQLVQ